MAITDNATHALLIDGEDDFRAQRAARELEAGTVWIDEHLAFGSEMPDGGVKGSGFGKDMSMYALEDSYDAVSPR
jgi:acyl-CoA reductase-like NAD-dependent aldehyde dehydrogenase